MTNNRNKNENISISVVLPAYNEEGNIRMAVHGTIATLSRLTNDFEVVVVNDGSKDRTGEILNEMSNERPIAPYLKVVTQRNRGYGGAIKSGFKAASKEWVFLTDSDLQFDIREIEQFVPFTSRFNFIFGYRESRADGRYRIVVQQLLRVWDKMLFNIPLSIIDIDCAFKLMRRSALLGCGELVTTGGIVSTEMIARIIQGGYRIVQLPVKHYPRTVGEQTGGNIKTIYKAVVESLHLYTILFSNNRWYNRFIGKFF